MLNSALYDNTVWQLKHQESFLIYNISSFIFCEFNDLTYENTIGIWGNNNTVNFL